MKKNVKALLYVSSAALLVSSCDLMKDAEYKVTPNPLEMHGDSVRITATVTFPEKGIHKKAKAEITPMLGNTALKTITVLGEKATGNGNTVKYKSGGTVTYKDVVAYKPEYENADLMVTGKVYKGAKEKETIDPFKIADATIITPLLVKKDYKVIMQDDNFQRVTEEVMKAQINFDKAKSNLRPKEMKDADIKALEAWLAAAETDPKKTIKSINIIGYASPEGEVGRNVSLSSDRSATAKEAIMNLAKKANNTKAQSEIYNLSGRGEDYDGFKVELEKSTMDNEEKQLVIRVLEMYKDPVQRETEMRNMAKTFVYLDKNIFPLLRRAEIHVVYDQTGHTDEELLALAKSTPDSLNVEELLFTATLMDDLNDKKALYQNGTITFPKDIRIHNNLGAVLYKQGKYDEAAARFESANGLEDNAVSKNNLGAIEGMKGNRSKAKELFSQAGGAGSEVNYNQGILNIMDGKYPEAVSNLGSEASFNKGLAQVLNGNPDAGSQTVGESMDKDSALGYYLKAIAAARMDKIDQVASNLKNAFAKDGSYKAKAAKDREFLKYYDNPTFSDIVK